MTGWILRDIFDFEVSDQDIAWIGQYSENEFNGVNGSIMDQFAIAMGRENHGIYLNAEDLSHRYIPIHLDGVQLVIACTNKERGLADSKYNLRRMECERAVADLQKTVAIEKLGELSQNDFEACQSAIEIWSASDERDMQSQRMRERFRLWKRWNRMILIHLAN